MSDITLVVVGSGEITDKEATDLLTTRFGEETEADVVFLAHKEGYTKAVKAVLGWADNENSDGSNIGVVIEGEKMSSRAKTVVDDTFDIESHAGLVSKGSLADYDGDVYVLASPNEDDETEYDMLVDIIEAAIGAGIPCLNLQAGLQDIDLEDEDDELTETKETEKETEKDEVEPKKKGKGNHTPTGDGAPVEEPAGGGGIADEEPVGTRAIPIGTGSLEEDIILYGPGVSPGGISLAQQISACFHTLADLFDTVAGGGPEVADGMSVAAASAHALDDGATGDEPVRAKRGRGRPRTNARLEGQYFDEGEGAWVKRGKGRVPAGVKTRTIDLDTGKVVEE